MLTLKESAIIETIEGAVLSLAHNTSSSDEFTSEYEALDKLTQIMERLLHIKTVQEHPKMDPAVQDPSSDVTFKDTLNHFGYDQFNETTIHGFWKNDETLPERLAELPKVLSQFERFKGNVCVVINYDSEYPRALVQILPDEDQ